MITCANDCYNEADEDDTLCSDCRCLATWNTWVDATMATIENAAKANGWDIGRGWQTAQETRSRYATFSRTANEDEYGCADHEDVKVRISDHGTCYCSEHYSVSMDGGGGDDHTIENVMEALASVFGEAFGDNWTDLD